MRLFGGSGMPLASRRARSSRAVFVLTLLVLGGGALIGATGVAAGPAFSETTVVTYGGTNTCTAESFTGTANMHFLLSENLSTTGVLQHHLNVRFDGIKAVTLSGKKYVVQDTFNHEFVFGPAAEETFDMTLHYIRLGEDGTFIVGDDFYAYLRSHITANANGMVTAFNVSMSDEPCQ